MNPVLTKCPVCSGDLIANRLHCPSCETTVEGSFVPGASPLQEAFSPDQLRSLLPFSHLSQEQLYFVLTFMRCEGRFNRMEDELGLSYPTLRGRLDDVVRAMGFEPARDEGAREYAAREFAAGGTSAAASSTAAPGPTERQSILDLLNSGEINVEEARRRLRGELPAEPPAGEIPEPDQPAE